MNRNGFECLWFELRREHVGRSQAVARQLRQQVSSRAARFDGRLATQHGSCMDAVGRPARGDDGEARLDGRRWLPSASATGSSFSFPYGSGCDWVRNVLAAGSCTLERAGRRLELAGPRVLSAGEGAALAPAPVRPGLQLLLVTRFRRPIHRQVHEFVRGIARSPG
jgi:hypothetical protein